MSSGSGTGTFFFRPRDGVLESYKEKPTQHPSQRGNRQSSQKPAPERASLWCLPLDGSPCVDSRMQCISQARVQTWANINVSPAWKSRMPGGVVSMSLNLCSVSISPASLHVEGQGFRVGPIPNWRFTNVERREAAYKLRFRASPPDTPPVILPCSGSLLYR